MLPQCITQNTMMGISIYVRNHHAGLVCTVHASLNVQAELLYI